MTSPYFLEEPNESIFVGIECREYPTLEMIYGFLEAKMGIKLRKNKAVKYADEQTHYKNYLRNETGDGAITTIYGMKIKTWGRVQAKDSLSLSLFHRPTRHSFAKEKYWDFDMVNCQVQILYEIAKNAGDDVSGLEEYCANPKKIRLQIAEHYQLKQTVQGGIITTAKEKAKTLFFRLAFGGSLDKWRKDNEIPASINNPKIITDCEDTLKEIAVKIWKANPHLIADCEKDEDFAEKSKQDKRKSVMARWCQTYERIIQEECITFAIHNIKTLVLPDIIPSQDGWMPLQSQIKQEQIPELFAHFEALIKEKFNIGIRWEVKAFDEAITIPTSQNPPINITLDDLELGETQTAKIIAKVLKKSVKYDGRLKTWYIFGKNNGGKWLKSGSPPTALFAETIQYYIMAEKKELALALAKTKTKEETDKITEQIQLLMKHYKKVGGGSYINQVAKYQMENLREDYFEDSLDNLIGKIAFFDGLYDLKKDKFEKGFKQDDLVMTTLKQSYGNMRIDDPKNLKKVRDAFLKILNNNEEHLEYFLSLIGYCFTGESHLYKQLYYCVDGTNNSKGDNGKSFIFGILRAIFPELVIFTDSSFLEERNDSAHKQLAQFTKNFRIVFADEGTQRKVNEERLKKIAEGGELPFKRMFGCEDICKVVWKFICASNHIPKVTEEASYNRYIQFPFCSHFDRTGNRTEENPAKLEFIAQVNLKDELLAECVPEIIRLILGYAVKFYQRKCRLPELPNDAKKATAEAKVVNDAFLRWWNETFEEDAGAKISTDYIMGYSAKSREETIKEMKRIGVDFDPLLTGLGKKMGKDGKEVQIRGGVRGWKKKEEEDEDYITPIATPI